MRVSVLALLFLAISVDAISFQVQELQEKCFYDQIPIRQVVVIIKREQVVIVYHELLVSHVTAVEGEQKAKLLTQGLELRVYDPQNTLEHLIDVKPGLNKFSFTSSSMGRYRFCVYKNKSFWNNKEYKYRMKIQQGIEFSLENAANKTHVMDLQDRIDWLKNRTQEFISLQQLNREQEDLLTTQTIMINQRVVQTTIVQIIVLLLSGVYQIYSLRKFFKNRFMI